MAIPPINPSSTWHFYKIMFSSSFFIVNLIFFILCTLVFCLCLYVCVMVSNPLQLELQAVVSCRKCWKSNPGPLEEHPALSTAELSLQSLVISWFKMFSMCRHMCAMACVWRSEDNSQVGFSLAATWWDPGLEIRLSDLCTAVSLLWATLLSYDFLILSWFIHSTLV